MSFSQCLREARWTDGHVTVQQVVKDARRDGRRYVFFRDDHGVKAVRIHDLIYVADDPKCRNLRVRDCSKSFPVLCVHEADVPYRTLDLLSEEVTLIESPGILRYVERHDYLIYLLTCRDWNVNWTRLLLHSIPMGLIVCDRRYQIVNCNSKALRMLKKSDTESLDLVSLFGAQVLAQVIEREEFILNQVYTREGLLADFAPLKDHDGTVSGLVIVLQDLPHIEELAMELDKVKNLNHDLQAILLSLCDELFVIDPAGTVIRASQSKIITANHAEDFDPVGRNFFKDEAFSDLPTELVRLVMDQKRRLSMEWESAQGLHILFEANPVVNESGRVVRVVVTLRDITETSKLKKELKEVQSQSVRYKRELEALRSRLSRTDPLVWASPRMEKIMQQVERVSQFPSTILLLGESGVGKEVIARAIHERSPRRDRPFVKINCAAIPETLLESELFGYTRGAFTGASAQGKIGLFEQADGGIVFLDEISEIPLSLQAKLLRVIQEKEVYRLGAVQPRQLDVQIIAATNRNLKEMVENGQFREDLYYRLNVIPIEIPPLRDRPEDISLLALHFLQEITRKYQRDLRWTKQALERLQKYPWPGNVRELRNVVERLVVICDSDIIEVRHVENVLPADDPPVKFSLIVQEAGVPDGVVNVVTGEGSTVGAWLTQHPAVNMISFTGSTATGTKIMQAASATTKRLHLELGGKAPFIVFDDADLEAAAQGAVVGAFANTGQDCTAATRFYVHRRVYDTFVAQFVELAGKIRLGLPQEWTTDMGPLVSAVQRDRVEGFVERARQEGAEVLLGGRRPSNPKLAAGSYYEPTILAGLTDEAEACQQEIFGPVAVILPFADEEEVIRRANGVVYGLAGSVWTQNHHRALRMAKALRCGTVWMNDHLPLTSEMPHGGFKQSGFGKDLSAYALEEYTIVKHVMSDMEGRAVKPWHFTVFGDVPKE